MWYSFSECVCNYLGTVQEHCNGSDCQCDKATGQCLCLPNVIGQNCDRCAPNTWQLASGTGCDPCNCNAAHSFGPSCNEVRDCCWGWCLYEPRGQLMVTLPQLQQGPRAHGLANTAWPGSQPSFVPLGWVYITVHRLPIRHTHSISIEGPSCRCRLT